MPKFNQESPEYISNEHYRIKGQAFMPIWTYKNKIGAPTANTTPIKGRKGNNWHNVVQLFIQLNPILVQIKKS